MMQLVDKTNCSRGIVILDDESRTQVMTFNRDIFNEWLKTGYYMLSITGKKTPIKLASWVGEETSIWLPGGATKEE